MTLPPPPVLKFPMITPVEVCRLLMAGKARRGQKYGCARSRSRCAQGMLHCWNDVFLSGYFSPFIQPQTPPPLDRGCITTEAWTRHLPKLWRLGLTCCLGRLRSSPNHTIASWCIPWECLSRAGFVLWTLITRRLGVCLAPKSPKKPCVWRVDPTTFLYFWWQSWMRRPAPPQQFGRFKEKIPLVL